MTGLDEIRFINRKRQKGEKLSSYQRGVLRRANRRPASLVTIAMLRQANERLLACNKRKDATIRRLRHQIQEMYEHCHSLRRHRRT